MSLMLDEARSAPEIIRSQLRRNAPMMLIWPSNCVSRRRFQR